MLPIHNIKINKPWLFEAYIQVHAPTSVTPPQTNDIQPLALQGIYIYTSPYFTSVTPPQTNDIKSLALPGIYLYKSLFHLCNPLHRPPRLGVPHVSVGDQVF